MEIKAAVLEDLKELIVPKLMSPMKESTDCMMSLSGGKNMRISNEIFWTSAKGCKDWRKKSLCWGNWGNTIDKIGCRCSVAEKRK